MKNKHKSLVKIKQFYKLPIGTIIPEIAFEMQTLFNTYMIHLMCFTSFSKLGLVYVDLELLKEFQKDKKKIEQLFVMAVGVAINKREEEMRSILEPYKLEYYQWDEYLAFKKNREHYGAVVG